jgi:hypothetical protein
VLIVDADERVPEALAREIRDAIGRRPGPEGYEIKRRNLFLGKEIRYSGWQNDWVTRLFRRDRGRYLERQVHERLAVDGSVGRLEGAFIDHPYRSLEGYWKKLRRCADWNAAEARRRGQRVSPACTALHPVARFLKAYLVQEGFLDGAHGLVVCLLTAVYAAAQDVRIWELQQTAPSGETDGGRQ